MTDENSYQATLEILKVLEKYDVSIKDARIIFEIVLSKAVEIEDESENYN